MFEDFDKKQGADEGRGRMGVSALISVGVFVLIMLGLGAAVTAHQVKVRRQQRDMDVTFADLPQVAPPKATKPAVSAKGPAKRKATETKALAAVKVIPQERPEEADGELVAAADTGVVDGIIEEKAPSAPPSPPPKPEPPPPPQQDQERLTIRAPRFVSGCQAPDVPPNVLTSAATIRIDVRMLIGPKGEVLSAQVVESNALIPNELVLACARAQVFEPAHLPDGTSVLYPYLRRFVFKPAQV